MMPDSSQPQPEQAQPATAIFAAQEQQTGHAAPSMSENEIFHRASGSWQRNVSHVRRMFTGFEATLMEWREGLELTDNQHYRFDYSVRPALEAMKEVLNETVAERSS